jgi:hypothetical protein
LKWTLRRIRWTLADLLERQHPLLVEVEREAGHAAAALGQGDGAQQRPVELVLPDLGEEVLVLLIQPEEAVVLLGPLDDLVEVLELLLRAVAGRSELRRRAAD